MEMPKPGADQERLKKFLGEWRGRETMHPTQWAPKGGVRGAHITNKASLGGFIVIQDYEQLDDGKVVFQGHAVILKNPHGDNYQMYWFDVFTPSVFEGDFDGDLAVFFSNSPMGQIRVTFEFKDADAYAFRMEMSQDGKKWGPMMDGEYQRLAA